jgi:four helix bundle protein
MLDPSGQLPRSYVGDPLNRMRVYRLACELVGESWEDAEKLTRHRTTEKVSAQLYAAIGSIVANLAEGYAHSSGKDRARIFEYALGSTRESIAWYQSADPVLGTEIVARRVDKLDEIRRMLMAIIPRERPTDPALRNHDRIPALRATWTMRTCHQSAVGFPGPRN